ncbi:hypothetical protein PAERUG_E15_London_28_01_14_06243 [Pseudomonas aeruginosa]|nr:hypothetical protein PAERUG_E15_London_28_01_14_06243 [Pseudomonas aeruginosa]
MSQPSMDMELSNVSIVTKVYSWRGVHVAYQANSSWIPCAEGNRHFQTLRERIANKICEEVEPHITCATKVYSSDGRVTGYDWDGGFIPHESQNHLFQLLRAAIESGVCRVNEPLVVDARISKIDSLIFCVVLERGWQHLAGRLETLIEHRASPESDPVALQVRLHNLPAEAGDVFPLVCEAVGAELPEHPIPLRVLKAAMIEIEISAKQLLKIFRGELARIEERVAPFVSDQLEQHLARSGRSKARGPSIDWLIHMAPYYLTYVIADAANVALQAFALEYGGNVPGHVTEDALLRSNLTFARRDDGQIRIQGFASQNDASFQVQGRWEGRAALSTVSGEHGRRVVDLGFVSSRARQLFQSGFAAEALVVVNAAFEVVVERYLVLAVASDIGAVEEVKIQGHRQHLRLLHKVVSAETEPNLRGAEFKEFVSVMIEVNAMRNDYLHQLVPPSRDPWKLAKLDRIVGRVLPFLTDPFRTMSTLGCLLQHGVPQQETTSLLLAELK